MKHLPILIINIILLCAFGCEKKESSTNTKNKTDNVLKKNENPESLEFWTADTIVKANPRLVALMDILYQYTRNEFYNKDIKDNIIWMQKYRDQLCKYFRKTRQNDSISEFIIADSIIAEARALWNLEDDQSTMGMVINNDIESTRLVFEQFNEYGKLNSVCKSEEQQNMLLNEFTEWSNLEKLFSEIFINCVDLHFWGGSISGPIKTAGSLEIWQAHIDLYKKEYSIITNSTNQWEDNGTFLNSARNLLISCCNQAIEEYYYPDETDVRYKKIYDDTKNLLKQLPMRIDSWCRARQPWENEMCTDWLRPEYPRHTSEVLIKLAHIISSVQ